MVHLCFILFLSYPSIPPPLSLSISSISLLSPSFYLSLSLSLIPSPHLSLVLSIYLSIYLSISISISPFFFRNLLFFSPSPSPSPFHLQVSVLKNSSKPWTELPNSFLEEFPPPSSMKLFKVRS